MTRDGDDLSPETLARLGGWEPRECVIGCGTVIRRIRDEYQIDCLPPPHSGTAVGPVCPSCYEAHEEGRVRVDVQHIRHSPARYETRYLFRVEPKETP